MTYCLPLLSWVPNTGAVNIVIFLIPCAGFVICLATQRRTFLERLRSTFNTMTTSKPPWGAAGKVSVYTFYVHAAWQFAITLSLSCCVFLVLAIETLTKPYLGGQRMLIKEPLQNPYVLQSSHAFFKPCGTLGQLFEVVGPPSAALHWQGPIRPKQLSACCTLGITTAFFHAHKHTLSKF